MNLRNEVTRETRGVRWIESLLADIRFALRQIAKRPLASATIVAVLGLGIGAHAGMFALLQSMTVRPAPGVRARANLVRLRGKGQAPERGRWLPREMSYPEYEHIAARHGLFSSTTAWTSQLAAVDYGDATSATSAQVQFVTGEFFRIAGSTMQLGTTLPMPERPTDGHGELVAVVAEAMWRNLLGGGVDVIGRTIRVNGTVVRIVGVAQPRFNGMAPSGNRWTLWMPLASRAAVLRTTSQALLDADSTLVSAAALLAPGATIEQASAAVTVLSDQMVARMTVPNKRIRTADVVPLRNGTELPEDPDRVITLVLCGGIALLVLLVACTNVSALVVGAGVARSQEIAIRLSLGASRWRLVRQLVTESCVLAVAGGVAGLGLYALVTTFISQTMPDLELAPDYRTAAFTLLLAVGTGILFGLSPALQATRRDMGEVLKGANAAGGARARTRLQSSLVVAQIAITQPLLLAVGVMLALVVQFGTRQIDRKVASHVVRMRFICETRRPSFETGFAR